MLEEAGTTETDYRRLMSTWRGLRVVTKWKWLMISGLLLQFSLSAEQLYDCINDKGVPLSLQVLACEHTELIVYVR